MDAASPRGPRQLDDPYPEVLERTLRRVVDGDLDGGRAILEEIRFEPAPKRVERWPATSTIARVYVRDRYQCRYCGEKTILPPVMRLLARLYPQGFPMHPNWKADATHPAFVSRATTLDHLMPLAGGGDPVAEDNLVTACWGCNRRKGDLTLEELGWVLRDPADSTWRGLTQFYEPAWVAAGRPALGESEMAWMRATRQHDPEFQDGSSLPL
jgi:5-methylcytosine-specific restriction endonuclease McrA